MQLIAGLGNPDSSHIENRHNVGFMYVEFLAQQLELGNWEHSQKFIGDFVKNNDLILLKPHTYMNGSGRSIVTVAAYYGIPPGGIYVVHDDLDIKLGEYKIIRGKGPKLHGGVNSIESMLRTNEFVRIRIGVDNRTQDNRIEGVRYVLMDFEQQEKEALSGVFERITGELFPTI